jgi:hypothetical protein
MRFAFSINISLFSIVAFKPPDIGRFDDANYGELVIFFFMFVRAFDGSVCLTKDTFS